MAPHGGSVLKVLSDTENVALGMAAGICSKAVNYPLLVWKNATQQGLPIVVNPLKVYRGLPVACMNLGGVTAIQFGLSGFFQKLFVGTEKRNLTQIEEISAAFLGGLISGVPCSIWELNMIQQQRYGGSLISTPARIISEGGIMTLFRGTSTTCAREAIFTMGMLGLCPVIQSTMVRQGLEENTALGAGALTGAIISATLTHPLDTIKTCMQGDCQQVKFTNVNGTLQILREESGGNAALFRGLGWRIGLISTTFFLANKFKDLLAPKLFPHHFV